MSNNQRKRYNSFHSNSINNKRRVLFISGNDSKQDLLNKSISIPFKKKEMISLKQLQNIEITTYDYIFVGRHIFNTTVQDFGSFITLLKTIKNKFDPNLFKANKNMEIIKKEGKFSISNDNMTKLIMLNKECNQVEISINTSYINISETEKFFIFYTTKSIFKGKHCFELEIMNINEPFISYGLIKISQIDECIKILKLSSKEFNISNELVNIFKLNNPIFYCEDGKNYNHFITYGDILGLCFDLEQKLLYIYINGILRGTHIITIQTGENCALTPIIFLGSNTEIIFNPGNNLKYLNKYNTVGFIPLDEKGKNNYEKSQMKNVTDEFIDILINKGKPIIMNKNISNSDINQIYHIIFDFLANISFNHSYIIKKSFMNPFIDNYSNKKLDEKDLEFYYICLKYILNASKEPKKIIKNLFLNLAEKIHILMKRGKIKNIKNIKTILKLFTFIFSKKEIIDVFSKMKVTTRKILKATFVSFHINSSLYKNNYLDFEINNEISDINNNSNRNNEYFPKLIIGKSEFARRVISLQNDLKNNLNDILKFFNELLIFLFNNGIDSENKNIFNIFKTFLKKEFKNIFKTCFCKGKKQFNNIFKNIFIPAMNLFNEQYEKVYKNNSNSLSIKKYLKNIEIDGEKVGGTIKHIFEEYPKKIPDFQELLSYDIKDYNNIFFLEFIYFFFIDENSESIWEILNNIVKKNIEFIDFGFLKFAKKESFEIIHLYLIDYINYKLFYFNSDDFKILLHFLLYFSDIIIGLYSTELIYFLPEKIFINIRHIIEFLRNIGNLLNKTNSKDNSNNIESNKILSNNDSINIKLESLAEKSFKQYISILIKFIKDQNIKKIILKCGSIECLQKYIYINECFNEEYLITIFDFINLIHNNNEYKKYAQNFMQIFENDIYNKESKYYNFGVALMKLIKNNKNFLRNIIILLYSNVNSSLTKLEERFGEYKFKPETRLINNNRHNVSSNTFNNSNNLENNLFFEVGVVNNRFRLLNPLVLFRRVNYETMPDSEKLALLEESFKDTSNQFIKLFNFYNIANDINELYDINSFENKNLINLLLSVYNIIFSPKNIEKLIDEKTKQINVSYKKLLSSIQLFYVVIITNILKQKYDTILEELSKQRNTYHFKEIFRIFEKYNPPKKENDNNYNMLNIFISSMEKIISEEELLQLNNDIDKTNIELTKSGKKIEINICPICADSIIDTHILPCGHSICNNCLLHYLSENRVCPFCRVEIKGIKEDPNFKV